MIQLTAKQARLLDCIKAHIADHGQAPSYDELCRAMGARSKASIHQMMARLEERGHIRRIHARRRAIEVVGGSLDAAIDTLLRQEDLPCALRGMIEEYSDVRAEARGDMT